MVFGLDDVALAMIASSLFGAGASAFGGSKNELNQLPTKTKEQKRFQQGQLQQAMGLEGKGGGYGNAMDILQQYLNPQSDIYKDFEAPYLQQFNEQIVPGLAERFAGYGNSSGALSSSGFAQALGGAGAGLQAKLAGLKAGIQNQSIGQLINQYNQLGQTGLQDQFAYGSQPGGAGVLGGAAQGLGNSLPLLLMMMNQNQGGGGGGANQSVPGYLASRQSPYGTGIGGF